MHAELVNSLLHLGQQVALPFHFSIVDLEQDERVKRPFPMLTGFVIMIPIRRREHLGAAVRRYARIRDNKSRRKLRPLDRLIFIILLGDAVKRNEDRRPTAQDRCRQIRLHVAVLKCGGEAVNCVDLVRVQTYSVVAFASAAASHP